MLKANIRFWGREVLGYLGITLVTAAVLWMIYAGAGSNRLSDVAVMPYYIFIVGAFVIIMEICSDFQLYFSLLLSMSVTRKAVIGGFMAGTTVMILVLTTVMGILWNLLPGDISEGGRSLLPVMAGGLFLVAAVTIFINTIGLKWGKRGIVSFFILILCMIGGGIVGVLSCGRAKLSVIMVTVSDLVGLRAVVLGTGVLLLIVSGAVAAAVMRKYEVRM